MRFTGLLDSAVADGLAAVAARLSPGDDVDFAPWGTRGGGSGSGPAALPLIELGVTVPRKDRN